MISAFEAVESAGTVRLSGGPMTPVTDPEFEPGREVGGWFDSSGSAWEARSGPAPAI